MACWWQPEIQLINQLITFTGFPWRCIQDILKTPPVGPTLLKYIVGSPVTAPILSGVYYAANWNGVIGLQRLNPNHLDASINHSNTIYSIYILYHIYHLWVHVHHLQIQKCLVFFHPRRPSRCFSELPASAGGPNLALGSMGTGLDLGRRKVRLGGGQKTTEVTPIYRSKKCLHVSWSVFGIFWKFVPTCF